MQNTPSTPHMCPVRWCIGGELGERGAGGGVEELLFPRQSQRAREVAPVRADGVFRWQPCVSGFPEQRYRRRWDRTWRRDV